MNNPFDYTPAEEEIAEKEALAAVYAMANAGLLSPDPLTTPAGQAMFQTKKEEVLRGLVAGRGGIR